MSALALLSVPLTLSSIRLLLNSKKNLIGFPPGFGIAWYPNGLVALSISPNLRVTWYPPNQTQTNGRSFSSASHLKSLASHEISLNENL